jgi:tetratricopeptide (TPR) repeat protein
MAGVCQRLGDQAAADGHRRQVESTRAASVRAELPFDEDYENSLRRTAAVVLSAAATAHDARGQATEAERLCQRAYAIAPGIPDPYRQLANMYHRDGRLDRALAVQQRLVVVDLLTPANHLNLASLLFEARQLREGEAVLVEAARRFPRDPAVMDSLALVYWRSGRAAKAREFAERAASLAPTRERFQLLALACRQLGDETAAAAAQQSAQELPFHSGESAPK